MNLPHDPMESDQPEPHEVKQRLGPFFLSGGDLRILDAEGGGTSIGCNISCDFMAAKEQC